MEIGTRVEIVRAGSDTGRTGVVVAGSMWHNTPGEKSRTVRMDDTGERLVFQGWMMVAQVIVPEAPITQGKPMFIDYNLDGSPIFVILDWDETGQDCRQDATPRAQLLAP